MRNTICKILCSLIFVSSFMTGCSDSNQTSETSSQKVTVEKESAVKDSSEKTESVKTSSRVQTKDEYLSLLEQLIIVLSQGVNLTDDVTELAFNVWKSALDQNNISPEVAIFTQPYDSFVSPQEAIRLLNEDNSLNENLEKIKELKETASSLYSEIENQSIPPKYITLYQDVIQAYQACHDSFMGWWPNEALREGQPRNLANYEQTVSNFEYIKDIANYTIKKFYSDEVLYSD